MFARLSAQMQRHPLEWLTLIAAVPRVFAAFFSGGYFAHDDHFLVIEAAQSWVDGADYNNWLPWNQQQVPVPSGHQMVYPGLHFLLFWCWKWVGFTDPLNKMIAVRLLHAAWSLITVRLGYRIALRLSNKAIAWRCGLFLALFYFMPFLAVRQLVEVVCVPLIMLSALYLLRALPAEIPRESIAPALAPAPATWSLLYAGIFAGLSMNIRFQAVFFAAGPVFALLAQRRALHAITFAFGVIAPVILLQGGIDMFIWGRPFAEMTEYVRYNMANSTSYFDQPWYNYLLVLGGVLIPPLSLAVFFGFARRARPFVLWLPVLLFILMHSLFPNKQERFILPIVPLLFVLGYTSCELWRVHSKWWQRHATLWRGAMIWTWTVNTLLLVPLCFSYSKRERVMAMTMLHNAKEVRGIIVEDSYGKDTPMLPRYYWRNWTAPIATYTDTTADLRAMVNGYPEAQRPNYVLFIGEEELPQRMARTQRALGGLDPVGRAEPGLLDRVMHRLNPVNRNETIVILKVR